MIPPMPTFLRPTGAIAENAILPGDPKRAMDLAVGLVDGPLMSNLARGLWGYHGITPSGMALTVQSTGIGGPSTAAVITELAGHGTRRAIRVGTCEGRSGTSLGSVVVVGEALARDGAGSILAGSGVIAPDRGLTEALSAALSTPSSTVVSVDLVGSSPLPAGEAVAADLSTAAFLGASARAGVRAAAVLVVISYDDGELSDEAADAASLEAGFASVQALAQA